MVASGHPLYRCELGRGGGLMLRLVTALQSRYTRDEKGASMVEYALLVALIAVVVIAAALFLGTEINDQFSEVGNTLEAT
jgi:pilus assembly protein Flp/PilA